MHIEVDQSGKIADTKVDTVLAYSNGRDFSIVIPAGVKREVLRMFRSKYRDPKLFYLKFFSAAIFLLIHKHITKMHTLVIDKEYIGKEAIIKDILCNYFQKYNVRFYPDMITFNLIGKQSPTHMRAYKVYTKQIPADYIVVEEDLANLL